MNDYYTHRKYLEDELNKIQEKKSFCIEFGTGDGSGLIFNKFAIKNKNATIISYDSNNVWVEKTRNTYSTENYMFFNVPNWDDLLKSENFNEIYDLVFIDQTPWEARIKTIDIIKDKTKVIILHDFDYFNKGVCENIYSVTEGSFFHKKYSEKFNLIAHCELLPPTLVMVNKNL